MGRQLVKEIALSQGKVALVDDADWEWLSQWKWTFMKSTGLANGEGYAYRKEERRSLLMHRTIMDAPHGTEVDHRDMDGLNNQRSNLRLATSSQNKYNRRSQRGSKSRFIGVSWHIRTSNWQSQITSQGEHKKLGYFVDEVEAAKAYDRAARELHGEFARCNFDG